MSYHVSASSKVGVISVPALTLERAYAKVAELSAHGYTNIVIIDAGTGVRVKSRIGPAVATNDAPNISSSSKSDS